MTHAAPWRLLVVLLAGCGSLGHGESLDVGASGEDGGTFSSTDAGQSDLDAYIKEGAIAVKVVTVSCTDKCANVMAVATGGNPPYSFRWDDGSTSAARQLCPTASTRYQVKVTDTGRSGEIAEAPQSVVAPLGADVIVCPDGGAAGDAAVAGCGGPDTVCWASWTNIGAGTPATATATIATPSGPINVTYRGELSLVTAFGVPMQYFTPASTYTCPTVTDAPTDTTIPLQAGGTTQVDSLTFSRPVTDPVFAIVSLGNSTASAYGRYDFGDYGERFAVLQDGPGLMAGPGTLANVDGGLVGDDGDGLVQMLGTFTTIQWTDPASEVGGVHGFTIGVPAQ